MRLCTDEHANVHSSVASSDTLHAMPYWMRAGMYFIGFQTLLQCFEAVCTSIHSTGSKPL